MTARGPGERVAFMGEKHVVVLGGGFGGLTFCQHFSHPNARVTVVDQTNHHLFQPLLYQVAMAGLAAPDIAQPIRSMLAKRPRLEVFMDEALRVDLAAKQVICRQNGLAYDYLVMALGSVTGYFGHTDWARFAPGLKTLDDALLIRRRILLAFEQAENERYANQQARLMTLVIVGAGPTGVELAGACAELTHRVLRRDFEHIDSSQSRIILIEATPRILPGWPEDLARSAQRQLEKLGVQVRVNSPVKAVAKGSVALAGGETLEAENILWTAGVLAHPITRTLGAELDRAGRVQVTPELSVPDHPEAFVIGDMARVMQSDGKPVPGNAPAAMQMARHVAQFIQAELDFGPEQTLRLPFQYKDKGTLATIGRSAAVAQIGKVKLKGFIAWLTWLIIHLVFLIGFRNKVAVLFSWIYSYTTYKFGARIITGPAQPSAAEVEAEPKPEPLQRAA